MPFEHKLWLWGAPALALFLLTEALVGDIPLATKRKIHLGGQLLWLATSLWLGALS